MEPAASGATVIQARRLSTALAAAAGVVPFLALVGWLTGVPLLAAYGGRFLPMAPTTALCFLVLSVPLLRTVYPAQGPAGNRGAFSAGALVAAYGALVAFGSLVGLPATPEDLVFQDLGTLDTHRIGRMSPATGVLFLLSGISLLTLVRGVSRPRAPNGCLRTAGLSGTAVLLTGAIFSLGYALGTPLLYESRVIPLALPTAISFLALGGALTTAAVLRSPGSGRWYRALNDVPIGSQVGLGLGVILALVVLQGVLAWRQTGVLWLQTKGLYEHPHQVRRAIGRLEVDVESMSRHVRDLFLARTDAEIATSLQGIAVGKADAERRIAILYDRYLGARDDVAALQDAFVTWNVVRDETVRLLRAGKAPEAEARIRPGGVQDARAEAVRSRLRTIDVFARDRGDRFYRYATTQKDALNRQMTVAVSVILLASLAISSLLRKGIKDPLRHLTAAANEFRRGRMDARTGYVSANEFGVLAAAFDALAETVEGERWINEQTASLAGVMLREFEARSFCRELLKALLGATGSQIGAVYLLNPEKTEFELFESIGLGDGRRASFSASAPEGELGWALATGRMQRVADIPEDTRFAFSAVSGELRPREIVTLPLLAGQEAVAVVSLASLGGYDPDAVRLLEGVVDTLSVRMNGVLDHRRIQELVERLEHQNRELEAQKSELTAQAEELTVQNTELELQKKQLDEASRLKSTFLSNMSHELRTPLNSVIALSGVLGRRLAGTIPEEEYAYLDVIERNGRQLLALINDILDLSRVEAGREEVSFGCFSLRPLVAEIVDMLAPLANEKSVALRNQVADDLPPLHSDPGKCRQILQNLVANAVKFTEAGSVEVSARRVGDELHVAVRDTGIGIAADQLPHIFDEFRQADDSTSRKFGGTGLGLAIAERYAALLHGTIAVESTPGEGSAFTLRLPVASSWHGAGAQEEAGGATARPGALGGQGQGLLLVEDNEPAVIQMTDILTRQGYEVRVARNGREALAQIEASLPAAVILDLMMPEMDGFEVLRQIRSAEPSVRLPVLILTAKHVTREELSFLKGNHVHQLIQKGDVAKTELLAAVARMVSPAPQPEPPSAARLGPAQGGRSGRPVVLVVEDNPDNRRTLRALLHDTYTVVEAGDGRAGVEQARRHRPDVVLMDLAMPVMDGLEALAVLREDEALRRIPVVAVTASAMKGDREAILAQGFDGYLSKPIDDAQLRKTLREALHED